MEELYDVSSSVENNLLELSMFLLIYLKLKGLKKFNIVQDIFFQWFGKFYYKCVNVNQKLRGFQNTGEEADLRTISRRNAPVLLSWFFCFKAKEVNM